MEKNETLELILDRRRWGQWAQDCLERKERGDSSWRSKARADFSETHLLDRDFSGLVFPGDVDFSGCIFTQRAGFSEAHFHGNARFRKATFQREAEFQTCQFSGAASFVAARFLDGANFRGASFFSNARLMSTEFAKRAFFDQATFAELANFEESIFALAWFKDAQFLKSVEFQRTHFRGFANFRSCTFGGAANFSAINAESSFDLASAKFGEVPNFIQAHFLEAPRLDHTRIPSISNLRQVGSPVGTYATARYRAMKRLAIQGHDHERELQFFADELRSQRGSFWSIRDLFIGAYGLFSDFGRSIMRPLVWWSAITVLFALGYFARHFLLRDSGCVGLGGSPVKSAIYLALRKGFIFPGLSQDQKLDGAYACLYGTTKIAEGEGPFQLFQIAWPTLGLPKHSCQRH